MQTPSIDFSRYPLDRGGAAIATIVKDCRTRLERDQYCSLPGFLRPEAIAAAAREAASLRDRANPADSWRSCYLQRVWNSQPEGRLVRLGTSPSIDRRVRRLSGSGCGTPRTRASV